MSTIDTVAGWIRSSSKVVVLTGAGISTDSGIPDFRGPEGVWTKNPESERLSDISYYIRDKTVRIASWKARLSSPIFEAEPNRGHQALAELERKERLTLLITQNIDGLHLKAGNSPSKTVEIHGTAHDVVCLECDDRAPMQAALRRVIAGEEDPPCKRCGGILKSATISFGQSLIFEDLKRSEMSAGECDLFLAIGTTLTVFPVADLPAVALRRGAKLVILNDQPTPYDDLADVVWREPIGATLPALVSKV